jgi:acetolactate synthase-1/2/3 large subunit
VNKQPLSVGLRGKSISNEQSLQAAAALIMAAERPIILAGNGVIRSKAWTELVQFVESSNVPFVNTFMAKGILEFDHPRNLFTVGGDPYTIDLRPLANADLVIAVGFDRVEYTLRRPCRLFDDEAGIIQQAYYGSHIGDHIPLKEIESFLGSN